ncbi:hypothetical protein [uncultured Clostridium sp.]|uniref:hypothetical protein n=1 Tax=uncultured Clostridium sp. TaxID=59620 RepID=UPI0028EDEA72|nr:hypothetical protein [uncultured Clostridium sp.]
MKPILFNTAMVQAILDGRKTCTRRVIKRTPSNDEPCGYGLWKEFNERDNIWYIKDYTHGCVWWQLDEYINRFSKFHVGDVLYVRETWKQYKKRIGQGEHCCLAQFYGYKADEDNPNNPSEFYEGNWKPSIHMPKDAARIFLKVTDVRVERLQDIDCETVQREGIKACEHWLMEWKDLWDSTLRKDQLEQYEFNANPYVWVIEFERCDKPNE